MGPQLDSCGRRLPRKASASERCASMGPQLDSCGRRVATLGNGGQACMLQWGRNLTVAEGGIQTEVEVAWSKLQWGRNLTVAEGLRGAGRHPYHGCFNGAAT